ncbi:MAG: GGDEF domain-containing protein [Methyloligellaceae bacterium]
MAELDRLKEELSAAQRQVIELENRVDEDVLLPVLNRRGFDRELERTLAYIKRHGTDISLIFIDLDDFKSVNDLHGHAVGDAALFHVTDILLANVRRSDIVARLGGDEFAILLHRANEEAAFKKADQLVRALASSGLVHDGKEIPISLTAGTTQLRGGDTLVTALERADKLMYKAKARRKDARPTRSA